MMVLGAVVPGCDDVPRYDGRLTAADSLIHDHADSALTMLEALAPSDLATEGDRAYHDLLLTQARYKCYRPATSDSAINRALAYYRAHPKEREKLTRAYIYKGTVMEELGHPDSAMFYYKTAKETAASDDYFNQGYSNMLMGALYNDYYSFDGQEKVKYEEALECFRNANDSDYIFICLNNLGCLYRDTEPKKAESMLLEASNLAKKLKDTANIANNDYALAVHYFYERNYNKARQLFWEMSALKNYGTGYKSFFMAANVYARLGIIDTAEIFLAIACENRVEDEAVFRMYHLRTLSEIAFAKRDTISSLRLSSESDSIEDSLTSNERKLIILQTEVNHDKESARKKEHYHGIKDKSRIWLFVFSAIAFSLILLWLYRRWRRNVHIYDQLISDLKEENKNQSNDLIALQNNINRLKIDDQGLKDFINVHMGMLSEVIEECYHSPHSPLSKNIKRIVKYQDQNAENWGKLYHYLDVEYNDVMSSTKERFPQLEQMDLLVIALTCMGYSCAQIAIVMGYSSSSGISTIRKRIASKMGLDCLLSEYIDQFKS